MFSLKFCCVLGLNCECYCSYSGIDETENVKLIYKENSLKSQLDNGDKDETVKNNSDVISRPLSSAFLFSL